MNNIGIAISINSTTLSISGNNFTGNTEHPIRSTNLQNTIINNNRFVNNAGTGLYITGNGNKVYSNIFSGNNIGVNINGNNTNFTSNIVSSSNSHGVVLTGNNLNFVSNNITANGGHGLVFNGNNPSIVSNVFVNNGNYGLFGQSLANGVINNNFFSKNLKTGLYLQGNDNKIVSNSFIGNGLGINIAGDGNNISNNNIDGNSAQGIYLTGNLNYIRFNTIKNNKRNAIYVKGSSVVIERNNISKNSAKGYSTIYINGKGAKILNNNILSNFYNGIEITGNSASITGNTLKNNLNTQLLLKGSNINIKSNSITGGGKYGIYLTGNKATIVSNTINSNGADGIYLIGNNAEISKNIIKSNKERGIYYRGSNSKIISNSINDNLKNGIRGKGNSNIFTSNKIIKNSPKKSYCAVYFDGNSNTYQSNNISSNDYHGLHVVGKGNKLINNYLEQNKNTQIIVQGNKNNITGNRAYNGVKYGLSVYGSSNILSKNTIHKNKAHGIILKGSSNQLTGNFAQYNSNYGVYINGSKNKIIQNTIRGNRVGIVHKQGSSGSYNYNYIVNNKKYNLYRDKGSINANYNWWGENKVVKVKNQKISRYVVARLVLPKVNYLKLNTTYTITFILRDNTNKNLAKTIPSTKAKFAFLRKVGKKWYTSSVSPKNQTLLNNKATVKIKTVGAYRVYNFKAVIDNQKLNKVFYPPYDLKVFMVANPNPNIQGSLVTYTVYINNLGPGDAYYVTISANLPKLKNSKFSFNGNMWNKLGQSINFGRVNKGQTKLVYVKGTLDSKFYGNIKSIVNVKSSGYDLKSSNNKYTTILKVLKPSPKAAKSNKYVNVFANCGPVSLQHLLASKGIFVSKNTLMKNLKTSNGKTSMYMMKKVAGDYGVNLYAIKTSLKTLKKGDIVLLNISGSTHYVTIKSIGKNYIIFNDPVLGPIKIPRKNFDKWYTGYTLSGDKKGKPISINKQKELLGGIFPVIIVLVIGGVAISLTAVELAVLATMAIVIIGGVVYTYNGKSGKDGLPVGQGNLIKIPDISQTFDGQRLVEGQKRICDDSKLKYLCYLGYLTIGFLGGGLFSKSYSQGQKLGRFLGSNITTNNSTTSYGYTDKYGIFHLQYGTRTDRPS